MSAATATLITCHANADFDAFAAMLAARHLYAPCVLLFPGSQERGLQKIYAGLDRAAYGFVEAADLHWEDIDRLVLVDTRQRSRVSHVAPLLKRPGMRIEVWDHHPDSPDDMAADVVELAHVGAVTSLLVLTLRTRNTRLHSAEATLLGLGIYGDTGSFTYSSTTSEDFQAAAWLLDQGMDVNQINEMAAHELTSLHVQSLNSLLESAHTYAINNTQVVLAEASMEHYLGDFAYLAHRLMEMEKFSVLFAIGIMGDRIQVVARSRSDAVNVGNICAELGGGGHAYAASASIRSMTINEVRETILRRLYDQAHQTKRRVNTCRRRRWALNPPQVFARPTNSCCISASRPCPCSSRAPASARGCWTPRPLRGPARMVWVPLWWRTTCNAACMCCRPTPA